MRYVFSQRSSKSALGLEENECTLGLGTMQQRDLVLSHHCERQKEHHGNWASILDS